MISLGLGLRMLLFNRVSQSLDLYYYHFPLLFKTIVYYFSTIFFWLGKEVADTSAEFKCLANEVGDWV